MKPASAPRITTLVLGGYGVFGGRLAELLSDCPELELLICGRNAARAEAFCSRHRGPALMRPLALDRADIAKAVREYRPQLVVDASGPFQAYGSDPYRVIEECIDARVNYLDFADAADFVFGVSQFDERATNAGVFVLSGVSSFPVLTAAVLRAMANDMEIHQVVGGIAPSPYAGIGLNVMRAVVGYAGAPVKLRRDGRAGQGVGLAESVRYTIAVPSKLPLRSMRFSLVDVPDLQVIPPAYPEMTDIWMGAGPVPEFLHRVLNLLARLRFAFRLPSLAPFSRLFYGVLNRMRFGEHRGGMFVRARGLAHGQPVERSWHLLAEGDDGPYIPSMAIEAIIRKLIAGIRPSTGARAATDALDLADYDTLFEGRQICTGFRRSDGNASLYEAILGSAYAGLPPQLQQLHGAERGNQWAGTAEVRRGHGLVAALIAALMRFPRPADSVPVTVSFLPERGGERWVRDFGGKRFSSLQSAGTSRNSRLLVESFGPISVALALVVDDNRLYLIPRRWTFLGIPLPKAFLPAGTSFETERDGKFAFDVEISLPLIGLIVAYCGTLRPA